jgi:hypothetical protein
MTVKITKPQINVREELNDLKKPTGVAGEAMLRAETPQEQFNLIGAGRRNLLINGDFQINQRGDSSGVGDAGYIGVDRWRAFIGTSSTLYFTQQSFANGHSDVDRDLRHYLKFDWLGTGSAQTKILSQRLEDVQTGNGQKVTLSFWGRTEQADDCTVGLTQFFGSGGSATVDHLTETIDLTTDWQYFTHTFDLTSTSGKTIGTGSSLRLEFIFGPATLNSYFEVAGVQLELGSVATPFEHRSYGEELALCQRYFNVFPKATVSGGGASAIPMWTGNSTSASTRVIIPGPEMRVRPTATLYGTSADSSTTPQIGNNGTYGVYTSSFHSAPATSVSETTSDPSFRINANSSGFLAKGAAGFYFYSNLTRLGDSNWCGVTLDAEL